MFKIRSHLAKFLQRLNGNTFAVFTQSFSFTENFWQLVALHEVTIVGGVPTAPGAVLQIPPGDNNISTIRTGLTGAALLPPTVGERFEQITNCPLHEILEMTETSGLVSIDP